MQTLMQQLAHRAPTLGIAGGLVWIAYGILAQLQPLGATTTLVGELGQLQPTNPGAFRLTTVLGTLAALLLALALAGAARRLGLPAGMPGRFGDAMAWTAALAALIGMGAGLMLAANLAASSMTASALLTPFGMLLFAVDASGSLAARPAATPFFVIGSSGLIALAASVLVGALPGIMPVYAALAMAIYGFGWVRLGALLQRV